MRIKLAALIFLSPHLALAEPLPVPIQFEGSYIFTLASVPFGRVDVTFSQDEASYKAEADVITAPVIKVFVQHESHTESSGTGAGFKYPNGVYKSNYSTRGKARSAEFTRRAGNLAEEKVTPPDNDRPKVPDTLKAGAFDPLSLALGMRVELAKALAEGRKNFTLNYYDGRRLTQVNLTYVDEKNVRLRGEKFGSYLVTASRTPLAGFTEKELKRIQEPEPLLSIYFSKDERLIPLKLDVPIGPVMASATLRM